MGRLGLMVAVSWLWAGAAQAVPPYPECTVESGDGLCYATELNEPAPAHPRDHHLGMDHWEAAPNIPWTRPLTTSDARAALAKSAALKAKHKPTDALLQLRIVESVFPKLADRLAETRGELLLQLGRPEAACKAYLRAAKSLDRNVVARARVGYVRCGLAMNARDAEARLARLLSRYPALPEQHDLRLQLAQQLEAKGRLPRAIGLFRRIDLESPASQAAKSARAALAAMKARGVRARPLTPLELTDRAGRLVRSGPFTAARQAVKTLLEKPRFPTQERARLHLMAARLARVEGRFDNAIASVKKARALGLAGPAGTRLLPPKSATLVGEAREQAIRTGERAVRKITERKPIRRLPNRKLRPVLNTALKYGLRNTASAALTAMARRTHINAKVKFESALNSIGIADDTSIVEILGRVLSVRRYRVAARYHYGRALERTGHSIEAEAAYRKVLQLDQSATPYYSLWANQRLWTIQHPSTQACLPDKRQVASDAKSSCETGPMQSVRQPAPKKLPPQKSASTSGRPGGPDPLLRAQVSKLLAPLIQRHGDAYPWFERAAMLVQLDRYPEAADELNEAYLALRDAQGSMRFRSGVEAVYSREAPSRRKPSWPIRRARLALGKEARAQLSKLSELLGDDGIALRFAGRSPNERPRAYAREVAAAAARYQVDPDLLFAVMRVESIYNRRIISHVGAIGLTQIMPRTGRLIADSLHVADFEVTDLLDPQTNLNFSAWYLASLIQRFEGHIPLAIASYNGGPHNVRLWLRRSPQSMPLDAFLEHIPFKETHRYVRRVLTHYAAYRSKRDLPMPHLSTRLPIAKPDILAF